MDYTYRIGTYEVTAGQYTEFLNSVAASDPYGLYNSSMWSDTRGCKIQQSSSSGTYTYSVAPAYANRPVNFVSFWDACRFANWLHNGQGSGDTESGAYTLTPNGIANNTVARNATWQWAVASEDEWYKAAYHKNDGVTGNYWLFPTRTDVMPGRDLTEATKPGDNCNTGVDPLGHPIDSNKYYTTVAGEFELSSSPYGTFDQAGNVWEWTDTLAPTWLPSSRSQHGGSFDYDFIDTVLGAGMMSSNRSFGGVSAETAYVGFRVVQVPEPASMAILGLASLAMLLKRRGRTA